MGKVIDLGEHSPRVAIYRAKKEIIYFVDKVLNWTLTPYQRRLLHKLLKPPEPRITIKPGKVQIDSFAGVHSDHMLLIIDEASNLPEETPQ